MKALVILSGGQDSTTCLFQALNTAGIDEVEAVTFNYGQRHAREIESAIKVMEIAKEHYNNKVGKHHFVAIPSGTLQGTSPLTNPNYQVDKYSNAESMPGGLEKTFVPGRNIMFLTIAANIAYCNQATEIYTGVSQEDYGGYPDCREIFVAYMQAALRAGLDYELNIVTPLINMTKAASIKIAQKMKGCWEAMAYTHTCYDASTEIPCGTCHACLLRSAAFKRMNVADPLLVRLGVNQ